MNEQERATVLAALRLWQQDGLTTDVDVLAIATNQGEFGLLDSAEIDRLCERLNAGDDPSAPQIRELARSQYAREGEIEIDDDAEVSFAHDHERGEPCHNADPDGAYVQAWVWVDLAGGREPPASEASGEESDLLTSLRWALDVIDDNTDEDERTGHGDPDDLFAAYYRTAREAITKAER